jgi:hypothetical protein
LKRIVEFQVPGGAVSGGFASDIGKATLKEVFMRLPLRALVALILPFAFIVCAQAQDGTHRPELTGKERLGPKWTDQQRIDNCHVPVDKRGSKPRPDACPNSPTS